MTDAIAEALREIAHAIRETAPRPCAEEKRDPRPTITMPIMEGDGAAPARETMAEARELIKMRTAERDEARAALVAEKADHAETRDLLGQARAANDAVKTASWRAALHAAGWEIQDAIDEADDDSALRVALYAVQRRIYSIPVGRHDRPKVPLWVSPEEMGIALAQARRDVIEDAAQAAETAEDPIAVYAMNDGRISVLTGDGCRMQRTLCAAAIRALAQKGGEDA